jgi:hypothetical protein
MKSRQNDSMAMRILGLAMIVVGLICGAAELAKGGAAGVTARQANAAATTAVSGMPRIENANLETRAVTGTLDSTMRDLAAKAEKPQWVAYSVDQVSSKEQACCGNYYR